MVFWPLWLLCRLGSGECCSCDAVVSIIEERQPPSPLLLCGSEEALRGWKRLMKSTRESVRVSSSQQCNSSCSPCTCSEGPLLSGSGWRSLNDLQISLIFLGPRPFRVLPGRMTVVVLALFLYFCLVIFPLTVPVAQKRWRHVYGLIRHQGCRAQSGLKNTVFIYWYALWWKHQQDPSPTTSEKTTPTIHQNCCASCTHSRLWWSAVQTWGEPFVYLLT